MWMIGYRLGMAVSHDGMIQRNDQKLSPLGNFTSEASSDNPSERRRAGKSLLLQNRRKRKSALESHKGVNKNFLSSASFRCSWEGPLGCLSPKGCAPQCQRKHGRRLTARTDMRLKYLSKDLEVHRGRRQWEPQAEEQQRGCVMCYWDKLTSFCNGKSPPDY